MIVLPELYTELHQIGYKTITLCACGLPAFATEGVECCPHSSTGRLRLAAGAWRPPDAALRTSSLFLNLHLFTVLNWTPQCNGFAGGCESF